MLKRACLVYLIMPSFMIAISLNVQFADAQRIEFILQFGTAEFDQATDVFGNSSAGDSGGVYVVGGTDGTFPGQTSEGNQDAFVRKYDSDGNEIWTRQFGTLDNDFAFGVSTDLLRDDVYVVGYTGGTFHGQTSEGNQDAFIRKYDSDGNEIWTRQFGTPEIGAAGGVSADSSEGSVYVVGDTEGTLPGQISEEGTDVFIRKYDSDGNEIWTRQFSILDNNFVTGVSADSSEGSVYVVGSTERAFEEDTSASEDPNLFEMFVRKYDSDGNEIWTRQFGTPEIGAAGGVSADSSEGSVYVVGDTREEFEEERSIFVRKYDSDDTVQS